MPLRIKDNALLVRLGASGLVSGTEEDSCCCPDCCCIDGKISSENTTQEACEAAGGVWRTPLGSCQAVGILRPNGSPELRECLACMCSCPSLKKICVEEVTVRVDHYNIVCRDWCGEECPPDNKVWVVDAPIPATQPPGTFFLIGFGGSLFIGGPIVASGCSLLDGYPRAPYCGYWEQGGQDEYEPFGCVGTPNMHMCPETANCSLNEDGTASKQPPQLYRYVRFRLVDSCSDCVQDLDAGLPAPGGGYTCQEGVESATCYDALTNLCNGLVPYPEEGWFGPYGSVFGFMQMDCACLEGISLCANEFP